MKMRKILKGHKTIMLKTTRMRMTMMIMTLRGLWRIWRLPMTMMTRTTTETLKTHTTCNNTSAMGNVSTKSTRMRNTMTWTRRKRSKPNHCQLMI